MRTALRAALFSACAAGPAAAECSVALALALDISSSVNAREYATQKDGLAAALRHPKIAEVIERAPGPAQILVYEWSGWQQQDLIADWTRIADQRDLNDLAARIEAHERRYAEFSTALGEALSFGALQFRRLPETCARQVIDVSGDGVNNEGPSAGDLRGDPILARVTVNGLVIKGAEPDPEAHYREEVIHGPGAFVMIARNGFDDYPDLILGKLLRELEPPLFIGAVE
ncbi:MAG: DUF1194 domain-containing protein [Pseudomonadota bacterium]